MKVQMVAGVSGSRDGVDWPPMGGVLECSDAEGKDLISAGLARPVEKASADNRTPEVAVAPKAETATRKGGLSKASGA